jgi:FixJ family two-component response regulator
MSARAPLSNSLCRWRAHRIHDTWHASSERDARQALGLPFQGRRTGAVEFLTKAVREQQLLDAVQQAIGRDRMVRQQRPALTSSGSKGLADAVGRREARVIAVVDDDEGFRSALQRFLRMCAFQVEAFASGEEFLRLNRLDAVGCVILDLAMPEMTGLEVQQQLAMRGLQIPIVFVTAHRDDELGQRAAAAGVLAVLRKPVDHEELVRLLREALATQ